MKDLHAALEKDYKDGTKENEVMGKYTGTEAIEQVNKALTLFCEKTGLGTWPEAAAEEPPADGEKPAEMEMEKPAEDAPAMDAEGGAEDAPAEDAKKDDMMAAMTSVSIGLGDFGEIGSVEELPKLLVALAFSFPVVGDAVKAQVMHWELGGDSDDHASFK